MQEASSMSKRRASSPLSDGRSRSRSRRRPDPSSNYTKSQHITDVVVSVPEDLPFQFISEITDDFSEERRLGEGAFGVVYKGVTKDGHDVAVKKLKPYVPDIGIGTKHFRNEFDTLTKLNHQNIVKVLGYCYETKKIPVTMPGGSKVFVDEICAALCLEYLDNGTLQKHLSDGCELKLDWRVGFKIIKGICEGLKYMHKDLAEPIYHFDLKPDNILLDKDMVPKIADLGLSRIFGQDIIRTAHGPYGTTGFQPPEYIHGGKISEKFDIFSLGAVITRILSGPLFHPEIPDISSYEYIDQVREIWRNRLQETCSRSDFLLEEYCRQVETCAQIAVDCLDKESQKRPDIVKITEKLNRIGVDVGMLSEKGCGINFSKMTVQNNSIEMRKESKDITIEHRNTDILSSPSCTKLELIDARETSIDDAEELIVGREEEKGKIISLLESSSGNISILPIHGIGGIGKTTFSRLIYNDPKFKCYSKAWVHVSQRFDMNKIHESIISQLSEEENHANEGHVVHSSLTKLLPYKKVMIVLDDLWEDNQFHLMDLQDMLYHGDSKIIILVTTRSETVAKRICTNLRPYKILPLTKDMCWHIIKKRSGFEARGDKEMLRSIGQEIAQKCAGVALAAQSLGFTLRGMDFDHWMKVKDNDIWKGHISADISLPNHVLASLMLSYSYMDLCLKQCFTYCAIFPKGHQIVKSDLMYQWISLGFIKPKKLLSVVDLCKKNIMQLQGLSFLQEPPKTYEKAYHEEQDTLFTMHDLVHDLATLLLGDEIMDQSKDGNTLSSSCRYALLTDSSKPLELRLPSCARLTALRFIHCRRTQLCGAAFAPANSLRVLDLSECHIQKLPESIGQLQQLRYLKAPEIQDGLIPNCITKLSELKYLDISGSEISALPESIGEMADLVHLDISSCSQIEQLPVSFRNLENLVHLDLSNCSRITGVSESLGSLEGLQHLDLSFCTCIGEQLPEALGSLTKLQYLNLSKCSYIQSKDTSMFPSIREKKSSHIQAPEAEVLGNLSKLKYLNLSSKSSPLRRLPEALGTFTGLEYLNLSGCRLLEELPASFGELCSLVHLNLSNCFCLNNIWDALRVLTKLQYLNLHQCSINVSFEDLSSEGLEEAMKNLTELWFLDLSNSVYLIYGGQSAVDKFVLDWISNLTNLEHLNLASNHAHHTLPDAFGKLKKLHTLDLSHCFNLKRLPKSISEIDSLKFLNTVDCDELDKSTLPQFKHSSTLLPPHFVVHTGDGECSSNLVLLKDEDPTILEISRLENVKSAEEAQMIKLLDKQMISELKFNWTRDAERFVEDIEVLKELVPPSSVDKLELQGYDSLTFPSWMMGITSYLPQLGTVSLEEIPSCSALPPLGQLPNLVCLTIEHMPGIRKIGKEFYGGERPFPALEQFYVCNMDNLLEWNTICYSDDGDANVLVLPRVVEWIIRECPILSFKPCPPIGGQLWQIEKSDNVMLSGGGEIYFDIGSFDSDIVVTSVLEVHCCQLPLHQWALLLHLPALETLRIENCSDLTCSSLDDILGGLSTLKKLNVMDCESFTELQDFLSSSDILGGRTSLWKLEVVRCESITALPDCLGNLTSLGVISIFNCPNIKRLPESIRQLTNLRYLDISDDCSPELIQWCESDEEIKKVLYIAQRRQRSHPTVWYVSEE